MNNGLKNFLIFATGAAIGSVVTWKLVKTTYEQIAQEEIDSVKEIYKAAAEEALSILDEADKAQADYESGATDVKPDLKEYANKISELGYDGKKEEATTVSDGPYTISPEDFGEFDDYETISLTYYADGVLADEMDEEIEDVEGIVGLDSLETFGEYEDDAVFVRNDELKCDYEILADERKYSDLDRP